MQIRLATLTDTPFLIELERASSRAAHWTEPQYRQLFEAGEDVPERLALVVTGSPQFAEERCSAPQILGFLIARHVASEWELENIVVASHAQRKGLGNMLLQALLGQAKQQNGSSVFLEVRESNMAARALYEKAGFQQVGRRKAYYANPADDAILYCRDFR